MIHLPQFLSQRTNDQDEKRRAREDYPRRRRRSNSGGPLDGRRGYFKKSIHERAKPQEPQSEKSSPRKKEEIRKRRG